MVTRPRLDPTDGARREVPTDLGFGSVVSQNSRARLLNRDGSFNVRRVGLGPIATLNLYHTSLTTTWPRFIAVLGVLYLLTNVVFAALYMACGDGAIAGPRDPGAMGRWAQAFFFSVETIGTIGYGHITPANLAANLVNTVEAFVGMLEVALLTGLMFARFARPVARVIFSRKAVVAPYQGITGLMLRVANGRNSQILEVEAKLQYTWMNKRPDGRTLRDFAVLPLERQHVTFFPLAWTLVHPIDPASPLHGLTHDDLVARDAEFLVMLSGTDETFAQVVYARSSYKPSEIVWGAKFSNLFNPVAIKENLTVDISRLHEIEPV